MYWKIKLTGHSALGDVEMRTCEDQPTLDDAIAAARKGAGAAFKAPSACASGQAFSDAEIADPIATERRFLETGLFW